MPLRLEQISRHVDEMIGASQTEKRRLDLELARQLMRQPDAAAAIRQRLGDSATRFTWPAALPLGELNGAFAMPPLPDSFSVAAADGSSMGPDRHFPIRYYIVNTGHAVITYGAEPGASLGSAGRLYYREEDLFVPPRGRTQPVEGAILAAKMFAEELQALLEAARLASPPVVAFTDGVIVLWGLEKVDAAVQAALLQPFLEALNGFREAGTAVANYISMPGAHDVVDSLRLLLCDERPTQCRLCAPGPDGALPCASLAGIVDRAVFDYLGVGERSALFQSCSPILKQYGEHHVGFFYLNVGDEIARIEAPLWVLQDPLLLDRVHATAFDQCRRGRGYPPALQEAHEQAAITQTDRRVVEEMIEAALARQRMHAPWSAKARSKRERGV
ncbi:MAG: DNA double-strand break repair nuclease NurA [Chloroflexi bacterium]|nr:DNA double-strand break repair nuclease NurA [Chloroflexota bacterium]